MCVCRLYVHPSRVRSVYSAAVRLKMDKVASTCAQWLVNNLDTQSCLEIRAIPGVAADTKLVKVIDEFIVGHVSGKCGKNGARYVCEGC